MATDNASLRRKLQLRRAALGTVGAEPVVLEAFGGTGRIFAMVYRQVSRGLVIERDGRKADVLARQRPTWSVYRGDSVEAVRAGLGAHLEVNLLDVDPWGDPWPLLSAFFQSERPRAARLVVVVTDGLNKTVMRETGWRSRTLAAAVRTYGNRLRDHYAEVCRGMLGELAAGAGYELTGWTWYTTPGTAGPPMAHYAAVLTRPGMPGRRKRARRTA